METRKSISADEASEALASIRQSRSRVAWRGFPAWYWIITGACLGGLAYALELPGWWDAAIAPVIAVVLIVVARAASRIRGVCEGWTHGAMTLRDSVVLYGPAAVLIMASAVVAKFVPWSSIVAAVLIFVLFAGTGLAMSARR